jgi:hypothetical protein
MVKFVLPILAGLNCESFTTTISDRSLVSLFFCGRYQNATGVTGLDEKVRPCHSGYQRFFRLGYLTTPSFFYRTFLHHSFGEAPQELPFRELGRTYEKKWNLSVQRPGHQP